MAIPVKNIYYLLCYAWNALEENDLVKTDTEEDITLPDLLARKLLKGSQMLLKRGIDRNYVYQTAAVAGVKGKLDLSATIKANLLPKRHTICSFDELTPDVLTNQLLYTTLYRLTHTTGLQKQLRTDIKRLLPWFGAISKINITDAHFSQVRLHRNNQLYGFLLHICQLLHQHLIPAEEAGHFLFVDIIKNEHKMRLLFETFIRNFYTIEQDTYRVGRKNIAWQFHGMDDDSKRFVPQMKTDILLENSEQRIIIDTKFYKETMVTNYSKEKIRSVNLYQLFSYLMNQEKAGDALSLTATGLLIYPTIHADYDLHYRFRDHSILIKTVNLNTSWQHIRKRLLEILFFSGD